MGVDLIKLFIFFWLCEPFGTCLALEWIGHKPSLFFVAQSDLCSR